MADLKLMALDEDDLAVIAAHMQDAVFKVAEIEHDGPRRQFRVIANRFVWEKASRGWRKSFERRLSSLHFNRVLSVRSRGFDRSDRNRVLDLLTVQFFPDGQEGSPGGEIELICAGDASILLSVECIEAQLADLGPAWETPNRPRHPER
jgi:hypothetical protein